MSGRASGVWYSRVRVSRPEFSNLGGEGIRQANPIKLLIDFIKNSLIKRNLSLLVLI